MLEWPSIWLTLSRLIPFPSAVFSQYIGSRPQNLDLERLKTKRSLARLSALPFRETSMPKVDNGNMVSVIYTPSSGARKGKSSDKRDVYSIWHPFLFLICRADCITL